MPELYDIIWSIISQFIEVNHIIKGCIMGFWNHTGKYGAPPRLFSSIKRMYSKIIVNLIIVKIDTFIDFKVEFKKGYIMSPIIFMLLVVDFSGTL